MPTGSIEHCLLDENDKAEEKSNPEREERFLAIQLEKERAMCEEEERFQKGVEDFRQRSQRLMKTIRELGMRGWEYDLSSSEAWLTESGDCMRIAGHEATVRVPSGPEATVIAPTPDAALWAALRGVLAALSHQDIAYGEGFDR